jgi:bifunctional DNA-binding transcriptional regulator/antitoxin component of YhaV-PrlF toxin-antitoxin module
MQISFSQLIVFFILLPALVACSFIDKLQKAVKDSGQPQTITAADGSCQVTIPPHWREGLGLNKDAALEAFNPAEGAYALVIHENRDDHFVTGFGIDNYVDLMKTGMTAYYQNMQWSQVQNSKLNGMDARTLTAGGSYEKKDLKFLVTVVATEKEFYQIVTFCDGAKYQKNEEALLSIINSLKTFDNPTATPGKVSP